MSNCSVCDTPVQTRSKIVCSECKKPCHPNCVNMTKADIDCIVTEKQIWRCPPCSVLRRRSMAAVSDAEAGIANISQVVFMLDEAREDRRRMEKDFNASFEFFNNKIDDQGKKIEDQSQELKGYFEIIHNLKQENVNLRKQLIEMESRLDEVEQYTRSNTVEIYGIPEEKGEDVYETVRRVCVALDMDVNREHIDVCHRLGKPVGDHRPAGIIARFVRRVDRNNMLAKRKVKRNFSTKNLGLKQSDTPVYVNESLSPKRRKLYAAARRVMKEKSYAFLWVQNGKVLMRKQQGSSVIRISALDDLDRL